MSRLIIVSNRLPVSVQKYDGRLHYSRSVGGLATGMACLEDADKLWVGWPGVARDELSDADAEDIRRCLSSDDCLPVHMAAGDVRDFYHGFCNATIWPLFHYFPQYCQYDPVLWESYRRVNELFREQVLLAAGPEDRIWIHDYHLMLLPRMLREALPASSIGFFLHIPFPSFEMIRLLPWRMEVLRGIMGADLIGFHEYDYVRHFFSSAQRIAGCEHSLNTLLADDRPVRVDAFPMGIDYERFASVADRPDVRKEIASLRAQTGDRKLIISIDRLDYTKGILNRLEAFDQFLRVYPEFRRRVSLAILVVPSRVQVSWYNDLRTQIEQLVGRINGEYGTIGWTPINYMFRSLDFEPLTALYHAADVALITPLRDGMNLVAKEYVATRAQTDGRGVLILSEMAGAACELSEALVVNPHDKTGIVEAIARALTMPPEEQKRRNQSMLKRVARYTVERWATDFVQRLADIKATQALLSMRGLTPAVCQEIVAAYRGSRRSLFLLDYDGTLREFVGQPEAAMPDSDLCRMLARLSGRDGNELVIISGRDRRTLENWLGDLDVHLVAEHGNWHRRRGGQWECRGLVAHHWKDAIRPILDLYADRTPGSFVEEKDFSLVWHCRRSDPELAMVRMQELRGALVGLTENLDLGVFEGARILEVKSVAANKGSATEAWLARGPWDFILCAGDDYTDEDMFTVMPEHAYTIKVGRGSSRARFSAGSVSVVRKLLENLAE